MEPNPDPGQSLAEGMTRAQGPKKDVVLLQEAMRVEKEGKEGLGRKYGPQCPGGCSQSLLSGAEHQRFVGTSWKCRFLFMYLCFLGLHSRNMAVPKLGVKLELPHSHSNSGSEPHLRRLCCRSQQRQILNPLSKARDGTCTLVDTGRVLNLMNHNGNSMEMQILGPNPTPTG